MEQTWYLTKRMVLCITSDVITGMDELKPLSCFSGCSRCVIIDKTVIFAPYLYDPFMVVAVIY